MSITFKLLKGLTRFVIYVFFGEVDLVGMENLSKTGPVILVGNHKNQFVDALMVVALVNRPVSFLIAEKSMHRPIIGDFARIMHGIPVVRPQDKARTIENAKLLSFSPSTNTLTGDENCRFLQHIKVGESVIIKGLKLAPLQVVSILSDTEITVKAPVVAEDEPEAGSPGVLDIQSPLTFKVIPKIDQGEMFSKTFDALKSGRCVCLFPEGGSSDRTDLLPLKAGVSVMALGAADQGTPVMVVPFGINYNQANTWRSRVLVDVGKPIGIPPPLLDQFRNGQKREAYKDFLHLVETGLRNVTLNAPDKQTLMILRCMRRMYQGEVALPPKRFMELNRKFVLAFAKFGNDPAFLRIFDDIGEYLAEVSALHVTDAQVQDWPVMGSTSASGAALMKLLIDAFLCGFLFLLSVPAYVVFLPMFLRIQHVVKQEVKKALAGSSVKVKADDVVASQKIIGAIIWLPVTLLVWVLLLILLGWLLGHFLPFDPVNLYLIWILPLAFIVLIFPYSLLTIKLMDISVRSGRRLSSHWLVLRSVCRRETSSVAGRIRLKRKGLVLRVQEFFELVVIPQIDEWKEDPIVNRQTIMDRRRASDHKRAMVVKEEIQRDIESSNPIFAGLGEESRRSEIRLAFKQMDKEVIGNALEE